MGSSSELELETRDLEMHSDDRTCRFLHSQGTIHHGWLQILLLWLHRLPLRSLRVFTRLPHEIKQQKAISYLTNSPLAIWSTHFQRC